MTRSDDIISHGIDLVCREYPSLSKINSVYNAKLELD